LQAGIATVRFAADAAIAQGITGGAQLSILSDVQPKKRDWANFFMIARLA
jgi:hypothetical protein